MKEPYQGSKKCLIKEPYQGSEKCLIKEPYQESKKCVIKEPYQGSNKCLIREEKCYAKKKKKYPPETESFLNIFLRCAQKLV